MLPHEIIRLARQRKGLSEGDMAELVGISMEDYIDIESYPADIWAAINIDTLLSIASHLELKIKEIFITEDWRGKELASFEEFVRLVAAKAQDLELSGSDLSTLVGYRTDVKRLADRKYITKCWNLDWFKAICSAVGAAWVPTLATLKASDS